MRKPTYEQARAALTRFYWFRSNQLKRTGWAGAVNFKADFAARQRWLAEREDYLTKVLEEVTATVTQPEEKLDG